MFHELLGFKRLAFSNLLEIFSNIYPSQDPSRTFTGWTHVFPPWGDGRLQREWSHTHHYNSYT